jgi:hypothetical protein
MPKEKSFALVVIASFVIVVLMPFARALARGDNETAAAAASVAVAQPAATVSVLAGHGRVDELAMLVVGACLLGLGGVLRRAA